MTARDEAGAGPRQRLWWLAAAVGLAVAGMAVLWWACQRSPRVSFLPADGPAQWVLYPTAPFPAIRMGGGWSTVFRRSFDLTRPPDHAPLRVRAFGDFSVELNDTPLALPSGAQPANWKQPTELDAGPLLRPGENRLVVTVRNDGGPPVLWLSLDAGEQRLVTDAAWECSLGGAVPQPARPAASVPELRPGNPLAGGESPLAALSALRWTLLGLAVLCAAAWLGFALAWRRGWLPREPRVPWFWIAVGGVALLWTAEFVNNARSLPFPIGPDADAHVEYIQYVQHRRSLPLADAGWEMHQTPLYYVVSAVGLRMAGLEADHGAGVVLLRALGVVTALALVVVVAGCVRRLFPGEPFKQGVAVLIVGFLPVPLYLAQYVANDLLAGTLAIAAVYAGLVILRTDDPSPRLLMVLGLCLGGAVLAKLSAAPVVVVVLAVLGGALLVRRRPAWTWLRVLGVPLLTCVAVSGWFFVRNYFRFGTPLIGSFDPAAGFAWWQDPGYGMADQFLRFGQCLRSPFQGAYWGIWDGLYSTLWGDGGTGGTVTRETRPPWNYDLAAAGYLLALLPSGLVLVGAVALVVELVRRPRPEWFLLAGLPVGIGLAMLYQYLRYPYVCHIKAFYGLPAVVSLGALAGWGYEVIGRRIVGARLVLGAGLGLWALVSYGSFWVDAASPEARAWVARSYLTHQQVETAVDYLQPVISRRRAEPALHLALGDALFAAGRREEAVDQFDGVVAADPASIDGHYRLGVALAALGRDAEAARNLERALELGPDHPSAYQVLAALRLRQADARGTIAVARQGLRVAVGSPDLHAALAAALAATGATAEAVEQYRLALRRRPDSVPALVGLARIRAAHEDARFRDGSEAAELARRACQLTRQQSPLALDTLAAACAEQGNFAEAEKTERQALDRAQASGGTALVRKMEEALQRFQVGKPWREKPALVGSRRE